VRALLSKETLLQNTVLVLSGTELIFFIVSHIVQFGFVMKSVDNRGMFLLLHSIPAFSASHPIPPVSRLGVHKKLGGAQPGQLTPTDRRDIP